MTDKRYIIKGVILQFRGSVEADKRTWTIETVLDTIRENKNCNHLVNNSPFEQTRRKREIQTERENRDFSYQLS